MHELSIALDLVEIASKAAREAGVSRVEAVNLRLGVFSGVVKDALLFGYDIATEGTPLQGSRLVIEDVPLVVYCPTCAREVALPSVQCFQCPDCESPVSEIRQGQEIEIVSMEVIESGETETA